MLGWMMDMRDPLKGSALYPVEKGWTTITTMRCRGSYTTVGTLFDTSGLGRKSGVNFWSFERPNEYIYVLTFKNFSTYAETIYCPSLYSETPSVPRQIRGTLIFKQLNSVNTLVDIIIL